MNQQQFIDKLAAKTGLTKQEVEKFVQTFKREVMETVATGDYVKLVGFGTFKTYIPKERPGRNPKTGEEMVIGLRPRVKFQTHRRSRKSWLK
jgi:nucleoid DNA-binding protein